MRLSMRLPSWELPLEPRHTEKSPWSRTEAPVLGPRWTQRLRHQPLKAEGVARFRCKCREVGRFGGGKGVHASWIVPIFPEKCKAKLLVQSEGAGGMGKSDVCGVRGNKLIRMKGGK